MSRSEAATGSVRQRAKAEAARAAILAAAASMMRRVGYAEMSLRDLAAEVNMKAGSLYYHFASKDELATEVMRIGVEAIEAAVREGLAGKADRSPAERLSVAVRIHLETLLEKSDFVSSHIRCYPFVPEAVREQLRDVRRSYDQLWVDLVRDFLGPNATSENVRYLRFALVGALNGSVEWFNPNRDSVSDYARIIERLLTAQPITAR
ncbi:TetR/AcrR family transcriptional regulator [Afifella pfennigii]|uniref:TetR/AcrR family transcriptional regulator n=1 Tax=Afifella pfennigii TaxID=209897 RepID=UPI00068A1494|nr:TetR/AcrR family transcriptional regulator [Afifella pfennigii]